MKIKRIISVLCILCMLFSLVPSAFADEAEDFYKDKSWDEVIQEFVDKYEDRNRSRSIALGYRNLVTGEEHFYKGTEYMVTCSMYKVPLNMYFTEKVSKGEMDWETDVMGYSYEEILEGSIVRSSNTKSQYLIDRIGTYNEYRRAIAPYMGVDPDEVDFKYYENNFFTAEQMIHCLNELYEGEEERFPGLIDKMLEAEPENYFNYREQSFDVAHKYGYVSDINSGKRYINDCGIIFTDEPIAIVMFSDSIQMPYDALADFCTLMSGYAQYHVQPENKKTNLIPYPQTLGDKEA